MEGKIPDRKSGFFYFSLILLIKAAFAWPGSTLLSSAFSFFLTQSESAFSKVSDCFSYDLHALHMDE